MSASKYELLKCDGCGKTLGYICVSVKIFPQNDGFVWQQVVRLKKSKKLLFVKSVLGRKTDIALNLKRRI